MKVFEDQGTKKKTFAESHLQSKLGGTGRVSAEHCGRCEIIPKQRRCKKKCCGNPKYSVNSVGGRTGEGGEGGIRRALAERCGGLDTFDHPWGPKKNFAETQFQCQRRGTGRVSADLRGRLELIAHSGRGGENL